MIDFVNLLDYRTRGDASPEGKPHLLVLTHPCEQEYFDAMAEDLLSVSDVAVFWLDPGLPAEECGILLSSARLLLLPIGARGLARIDELSDLLTAAEQYRKKPIPILMEEGLLASFASAFGEVQFLDRTAREASALSYHRKLGDLLGARFLNRRTRAEIEAAFGANLFISYRKRDRRHAVRLLEMLHEGGLYDVGIWYDEFLTAGEIFSTEIQAALERADAILLVVTPSLFERDNYVLREELPFAAKCQKPILPILFEPTDLAGLVEWRGMLAPVAAGQEVAAAVRALLSEGLACEKVGDAAHLYCLGMASLLGHRAPEDPERAFALLSRAAALGHLEARGRLAFLLESGRGCPRDVLGATEHRIALCAAYDAAVSDRAEFDRDLVWDRYLAYRETCRLFLASVPPEMRVEDVFRGAVNAVRELSFAGEEEGVVLEYYGDHLRECGDLARAERCYREAIDAVRGEETADAVRVLLSVAVKLAFLYGSWPGGGRALQASCVATVKETISWLLSEEGIPTMATEAAAVAATLAELPSYVPSDAERSLFGRFLSFLRRCASRIRHRRKK